MKYLDQENQQFTRVSKQYADQIMEGLGFSMASDAVHTVSNVYIHNDERFTVLGEVTEAVDGESYARLEQLTQSHVIELDESGSDPIIESVNYDDEDYLLEGVFEDEDGILYAKLVSENSDSDEEEDKEEEDEDSGE